MTAGRPNGHRTAHPGDVAWAPPQLKGDDGEVLPTVDPGAVLSRRRLRRRGPRMAAGAAADEEETVVEVVEDDVVTDPPCSCRYSGVSGTRLKGTVSDAPSPAPPDPANIATARTIATATSTATATRRDRFVVLPATLSVVVATGR